jgi:hypothetical protein
MVSKNHEPPPFQHVAEVLNAGVDHQQLTVKGAVLLFRRRQLSREKSQRPPSLAEPLLLQNSTNMCCRGI